MEAPLEKRRAAAAMNIERRSTFLWINERPVSMAGAREFGEGIARIGPVYTPPAERRNGYAGALTAAVTQAMLDQGCSACTLLTDRTNRTSNHIYWEIGYRPLADFSERWFQDPPGTVP